MKNNTQKIIKQIATKNNVSEEEVKKEIEKAIEIGINNKNPKIREQWKSMSKRGKTPTIDEVILYIAKEINKKSNLGGNQNDRKNL